ncbi:MAG: type II secretion system major pseudopilin GspG [Proteobacteria bacterium]|nr:type II secretion system major pseudopilin GspG [Pseudomonadota bacterium]
MSGGLERGGSYLKRVVGAQQGFTLIEIMVVIVILAILAAVVAPRVIGRVDESRVTESKVQVKNFETALKMYRLDNGKYPTTSQGLVALVEKPTTNPVPRKWHKGGYLEKNKIPSDPWGNSYLYLSPGLHGDYDLLSYGADGLKGGADFDADINNWEID